MFQCNPNVSRPGDLFYEILKKQNLAERTETAMPQIFYFSVDDLRLIVHLCGGDKSTQEKNIDIAKAIAGMPLEEEDGLRM